MDKDYDTLIQSLSETIADYRQNEIAPITPLHIEKWLHQFDSADQFIILLVLWWGDPNLPPTHPLGKWYPLFPRRTNMQRVIMTEEQIFDDHSFSGECQWSLNVKRYISAMSVFHL